MQLAGDPWIELRSGRYHARVAPAAGGRIAALEWRSAGDCVPLLVAWDGAPFDEHDWPKAGAFPMLPFANRLPSGGLRVGGRLVRPEAGRAGFALHGFAHRRPWQVLEAGRDRARMRFTHQGTEPGWAWAFTADQHVELAPSGLTATLVVRNDSPQPMPLGLGWHPYHPAATSLSPDDLRLCFAGRHRLDGEGRAADADAEPLVGVERGETTAFSGWTGGARLRLAGGGAIAVHCRGAGHVVVHRPTRGDYLCIEPVTVLPGHLGDDAADADAGTLLPGATREVSWTCAFLPPDRPE